MFVQEQAVAVGWPLNLGHDTTGWPLGLRLRLLHEDLQWPRMPELAHSSSGRSTDSSSLDTMSTRSFFQDNSRSLGALIGLPILDGAGNPVRFQHQQQQPQRRQLFRGLSTVRPNSPASSPVFQNTNNVLKTRAKARRHQRGRTSARQQQHLSASSTAQCTSAGWSLLSALSCARVPAEIGAAENEDEETSIPRAQLVARGVPSRSSAEDPELELQGNHGTTDLRPLPPTRNSSQQHLNSLAKKFYDNITFEDEELEMCNKQRRSTVSGLSSDGSPEWNPLFASSPQAARDEEKNDLDNDDETSSRRAGTMTTMCDQFLVQRASCTAAVPLMTILGRSNNVDADHPVLYCRKGSSLSSMTFCVDVGKWQQKQKLGQWRSQLVNTTMAHEDNRFISHPAQESLKSKAVAAFIYRMLACWAMQASWCWCLENDAVRSSSPMRLNRRMRTSQIDGAWLNTCIGPFARCRMLWGSIFRKDTAAVLGGPE